MKRIVEFIQESCFLKQIPRSGYQFLGSGRESVAEHIYVTTLIAFVMSQLQPEADARRLLMMCLLHDLPETRLGDLNYVQKKYIQGNEAKALADTLQDLPFDVVVTALLDDFNAGLTLEAKLARDADQLSLLADLKRLQDLGHTGPQSWIPRVKERLKTETGRQLAEALMNSHRNGWWLKLFNNLPG